jgi:RNA polymerase sigma factor (sigma-70 family)
MELDVYYKIRERCEKVFKGKHQIFDDDIINDAILSILSYYSQSSENIQNFEGWLNGAIHHHYCSYIRNKSKHIFTNIEDVETELAEFDFDNSYEERRQLVYDLIQRLDNESKNILTKRFYEGKSYADLAKELLKSEAAVRKQVSRAINKISELVKKVVTILIFFLLNV